MAASGKIQTVRLNAPIADSDIAALEIGQVVYLDGLIYTGREGVYNRVLAEGKAPPVDLKTLTNVNFHCSPAAAKDTDGTFRVGAVTATASFRFSKWLPRWFAETGCKVIIGKGGLSWGEWLDNSPSRDRRIWKPSTACLCRPTEGITSTRASLLRKREGRIRAD